MMKCTVSKAHHEDLESLVSLKVACTHENYRGFFDFAPLNEQNPQNVRTFFLQMLAAPDTYVTLLRSQDGDVGYAVSRLVQTPAGDTACELLAIDVNPRVTSADFHSLIITAIEATAEKGLSMAFVYLLNNNFRSRLAFEHIGFRKDGTAVKEIIGGERFDLLRYVYCISKPCAY